MFILIVLACLIGGLIAGVAVARITNVLRPGRAVAVGLLTGIILGAVMLPLLGVLAACAGLLGALIGCIGVPMLIAAALGGC